MAGGELAEHGVGELAVHLDVFLAGERVAVLVVDRPRVAEDPAEDVGQEVGEEFLLLERVGLGRPEQPGPAGERFACCPDIAGQMEAGEVGAENVGPEQRLGFDGHACPQSSGTQSSGTIKTVNVSYLIGSGFGQIVRNNSTTLEALWCHVNL